MITRDPINTSEFLSQPPDATCGASASFVGVVRNHHDGKAVTKLFYDCFEPLAEKQIQAITKEARDQFGVTSIEVLHRIGELQVGDAAVAILVHSTHRDEAFAACRFVIEEIKHKVPIWKHEFYGDGTEAWVRCNHASETLQ